ALLAKLRSPRPAIDDTAWLQSHIDPTAQQQPILTQVNGTGPYRLDAWDGSGDITLSRYDGYWGTPALTPSIIFVGEEDAGQRFSKLREGSVDAVDELAPGDVEAAQANPDLTITPRQGLNTAYSGLDNRVAPFDNETVRRAIALGIGRPGIVDASFPPATARATTL